MMKKVVTLVLSVDADEPWETDDFIKKDLEQEINFASLAYGIESIEIKDANE